MQSILQFASQHPLVALGIVTLLTVIVVLVWHRNRWRELYTAVEFVRNNQPVEKNDKTYGHRLVWQGSYWDVEFKLDDRGAIAMHSDGHEKGWRVVGPLWWLRLDEKNPNGFYRRFRWEVQCPVPFGIRRTFAELVRLAKEKGEQFAIT